MASETIRESVIIAVDFVQAGEAREGRKSGGPARIIDFQEARLARCTAEPRPASASHRPSRPFGGAPGGYGGPF